MSGTRRLSSGELDQLGGNRRAAPRMRSESAHQLGDADTGQAMLTEGLRRRCDDAFANRLFVASVY
jgi:hypothetical protein